jgi:hypothetical protein
MAGLRAGRAAQGQAMAAADGGRCAYRHGRGAQGSCGSRRRKNRAGHWPAHRRAD